MFWITARDLLDKSMPEDSGYWREYQALDEEHRLIWSMIDACTWSDKNTPLRNSTVTAG